MMERGNLRELTRRSLCTLQNLPAFPPFCEAFFDLIDIFIEDCRSRVLDQLFLKFLQIEIQKYRCLSRGRPVEGIQKSGMVVCDRLKTLVAQLDGLTYRTKDEEIAANLLAAACYEQLGRTLAVVSKLYRAEALGCRFPLVEFALGYHLYILALTNFAHYDSSSDTYTVHDCKRFRATCQQALKAFQRGLSDSAFDAQLYWWMGVIYENLHQTNAARWNYKLAGEADPESFAADTEEKLRQLPFVIPDAASHSEQERLASLPEITSEEVAQTRRELEEIHSFEELELEF